MTWVHPLTTLSIDSTSGTVAFVADGSLPHGSSVGPWGSVHLCY